MGLPVLSVLLVLVSVTACSSSSKAKASSGSSGSTKSGDYVIGVDDYLSGSLAFYGQAGLQDDQAAVNYVNAHGGINGHDVKLVTADAGAAGATASSAAVQLLETDHVNAIVGLTVSDDCGAVAPLAAAHSVPEICISTPGNDLQPVQKYVFGIDPLETQNVKPMLSYIKDTLKLPSGSTFATIVEGDAGEQDYASAAARDLTAAGYKQVDSEVIALTASSPASEVSKLVAAKPQVVLAGLVSPFYQPLIGALRAAGDQAPVFASEGSVPYTSFLTIKDKGLDAIELSDPVTSTTGTGSGLQQYVAALGTVGASTPSAINGEEGGVPYFGDEALFAGLKTCGYPCSGADLASALDSVSLTAPGLVDGSYGWSSSSHVLFNNASIWAYDGSGSVAPLASNLPLGPISG